MSYVLASTDNKVKWYKFRLDSSLKPGEYELLAELDLSVVPLFKDKDEAKRAAQFLGLKTWRYVKI